jgi:hypothetical protein
MRRSVARRAFLLLAAFVALSSPSPAAGDDAGLGSASAVGGQAGIDAGSGAACGDGGTPACPVYARYVNDRFAFSVDVPTFLARKGADADGRAQSFAFTSSSKKIRVRAWAMYNAPVMTVEELFGDWCRRGRVTFKSIAGNTWVVRGTENGQLFYMRSNLADGIITTIEAVYDPSYADDFEPVLSRMGSTLMTMPGQGVRAKGARPTR